MLRKIVLKILFYSDSLEIEINGKLIFSRLNLGRDPDIDEIVEITKWGHKVASVCVTRVTCLLRASRSCTCTSAAWLRAGSHGWWSLTGGTPPWRGGSSCPAPYSEARREATSQKCCIDVCKYTEIYVVNVHSKYIIATSAVSNKCASKTLVW